MSEIKLTSEEKFRKIVREILDEIMSEQSTSGGAGAYSTPFAFSGGKAKNEKKRKKIATQLGFKLAPPHAERKKINEDITSIIKNIMTGSGVALGSYVMGRLIGKALYKMYTKIKKRSNDVNSEKIIFLANIIIESFLKKHRDAIKKLEATLKSNNKDAKNVQNPSGQFTMDNSILDVLVNHDSELKTYKLCINFLSELDKISSDYSTDILKALQTLAKKYQLVITEDSSTAQKDIEPMSRQEFDKTDNTLKGKVGGKDVITRRNPDGTKTLKQVKIVNTK